MTTTTRDTDARLARIHETGYWRVTIRPTVFDERRIPTLHECEQLIEETRIRLGGWDYPHVDHDGYDRGEDFIQSGSDFANHVELWRFYQSGQFVHHFAMRSDRMPANLSSINGQSGAPAPGPPQLDFVDLLYTLTEILEFTKNLAYRGILDPAGDLRVELHGVAQRMIVGPPGRLIDVTNGYYMAKMDSISWTGSQPAVTLIADASRLALDATIHILERFNWLDPSRSMLEADQRRFLERRL